MKTIVTTLLLLLPLSAAAQQGTVLYDETVKMEVQLPPEMKHMEKDFPTERTVRRQLLFDGGTALMTTLPEEKEDEQLEAESGGMRIQIRASSPDDAVYTDYDAGARVERREFLGRTFLIKGAPPEPAWRLTDERSTFLGYTCQKAVATRDSVEVEAWFTPEIPVPAGPGPYGGLPGLILVLTEDGGRRSFTAREVSLEALAEGALAAPDEGREVTREEFDAIVEEKMKELGAERGRGGAFIRIQH